MGQGQLIPVDCHNPGAFDNLRCGIGVTGTINRVDDDAIPVVITHSYTNIANSGGIVIGIKANDAMADLDYTVPFNQGVITSPHRDGLRRGVV